MKREDHRTKDNEPLRNFTMTYVQTNTSSQQSHEKVDALTYFTSNVYQSQHKNASNPFASALADAFGVEEAYS